MTPLLEVVVIGNKGQVKINGILDTGFDGKICLPIEIAVDLGLELVTHELVELADGTKKDELVFGGRVRFLGNKRPARIFLTTSEDTLIGTGLLKNCRALIDFDTGNVRIRKRAKS